VACTSASTGFGRTFAILRKQSAKNKWRDDQSRLDFGGSVHFEGAGMVTPGERSNASICADFPASALLLFDCDPQSAQISPSRKGLPQGWARDVTRRDAQITQPEPKSALKQIRIARNPDWWKSRSEHEPNG
jgi:hypothetical protein